MIPPFPLSRHIHHALVCLTLLLFGCSAKDAELASGNSIEHEPGLAPISEPSDATDEFELLTLDNLISDFEQAGLKVSERQEKWFGLIMAIDGAGIEVEGNAVEVYAFDTTITTGRDALERLVRDGIMGQRVLVHKNLAIINDPKHEHWEAILAVFEKQ